MEIKEDAEKILEEFSKTLETIPELDETQYIVDNVNLTREDKVDKTNPKRIMKNAKTDKNGNITVKKADWVA
ncbi:Asp-tRNA(Asn) amidotransferase subunit GatC [Methanobrevibacter curvatus]|uniref:Aspartyl/glutamyl-tRNA amidotransferase subunit C n=1 Tax=Methanobrevibacter curvatus TaxID=49547 RepID=A0A166DFJ1_9EURY|nr:Asp-tRNA(Asn) amidotransferase subunit GatC [Methanobrevibacter curvatus]KZX15548.1 aspartyl/glutamyl-tRNA amidotransferase subunit C [Methanobrevibacter curvatus]